MSEQDDSRKDAQQIRDPSGRGISVADTVNDLIRAAIRMNASDIHVEPEEKTLNIRFRIDGMLARQQPLSLDCAAAVLAHIKVMAGLDASQKRLPQDGRILMNVEGRPVHVRVSSCPTVHGENIVLRILDQAGAVPGLSSLGFAPKELALFREIIGSPYGIVLVTGPAGSGTTTMLYSALQELNKEDVSIMTVEDPIEYQFPGMRQVQVNAEAGFTFGMALRTFLRQDPDIIMVSELRDRETAQLTAQAALTGHLVFSALHTNDSFSSFSRLVDMGIEPFLVSSSVMCVLAQRLVRRVCDACKELYVPSDEMLRDLGLDKAAAAHVRFAKGKGCKICSDSGYKGRIGIYELLKVTPEIQELILKRASGSQIRAVALKQGVIALRQAAVDKLIAGITSVEEVFRVSLDFE